MGQYYRHNDNQYFIQSYWTPSNHTESFWIILNTLQFQYVNMFNMTRWKIVNVYEVHIMYEDFYALKGFVSLNRLFPFNPEFSKGESKPFVVVVLECILIQVFVLLFGWFFLQNWEYLYKKLKITWISCSGH